MALIADDKARLFDTAAQTADTDVLTDDVVVGLSPVALIITIQVASVSTVKLVETVDGTTKEYVLNDGNELGPGELFTFEIPVRDDGSYNIRLGSGVAIDVLNVDTVPIGGV